MPSPSCSSSLSSSRSATPSASPDPQADLVVLPRRRRARYVACACVECRRRKIKCSGGDPCRNCVFQEAVCHYPHDAEAKARKKKEKKGNVKKQAEKDREGDINQKSRKRKSTSEDTLQKRLRRLEEEVSQLRSGTRNDSGDPPLGSTSVVQADAASIADVSEAPRSFSCGRSNSTAKSMMSPQDVDEKASIDGEAQGRTSAYISLAMQIRTLKNSMAESDSIDETLELQPTDLESCLVPNDRLFYLLEVFFNEFNFYMTILDCNDFTKQLVSLFEDNCPEGSQRLVVLSVRPDQISLVALTCLVLAFAELQTPDYPPETTTHRSHQDWYAESQRVMTQYFRQKPPNLDLVRLRLMEAFYMLMIERVDRFSIAVIEAVDHAFATGLNDQSSWPDCTRAESRSRRSLWWVLYLMDRQAAQRYGRSYLIRDPDFAVDDFSEECREALSDDASTPPSFLQQWDPHGNVGMKSWEQTPYSSSGRKTLSEFEWYHYLEFVATFSRLVTRAWDSFYCLRAPKAGDYEETESIDALLLRIKRNLCPGLVWRGDATLDYDSPGSSDQIVRLRLIVLLRINLLRLSIRRHLWRGRKGEATNNGLDHPDFAYTVRLCRSIAQEAIEAITHYIGPRIGARSFGAFSTVSLIECIYTLVALPSAQKIADDIDHCGIATAAVQKAVRCIQMLAQSHVKLAQSAFKVLGSFLQPGICVRHHGPEHSICCTLLMSSSNDAMAGNFNSHEVNVFDLPGTNFELPAQAIGTSLNIEDMLSILDRDILEWPSTIIA